MYGRNGAWMWRYMDVTTFQCDDVRTWPGYDVTLYGCDDVLMWRYFTLLSHWWARPRTQVTHPRHDTPLGHRILTPTDQSVLELVVNLIFMGAKWSLQRHFYRRCQFITITKNLFIFLAHLGLDFSTWNQTFWHSLTLFCYICDVVRTWRCMDVAVYGRNVVWT